jgi:PAS domain S-box-containing protein
LTPPEEHERMKADTTITLATGVMRNAEYTMLRKNGSRFPVELSAAASTNADGQSRGIVIVVRDITARRQAEARIRELLHILDQAHDAIIIHDLEGRIHYFNKGAERILGWTADEVRGRCVTDLFFEDTSTFAAAQEKLLQAGKWDGELPILTKARQPRIVHSRWTLVPGEKDQSAHVVCINTDITESKRAEEALRQSQERYRTLAESSPDAIFILDRKSAIQYVNSVARQWLGKADTELIGRSPAEFFPPEIVRQQQENLQRVFKTGEFTRTERAQPFRGTEKWIETRLVPLRNPQGEIQSVMGIARDLTEQKRTAEALKEREELSQKIIGAAMEGFWMLNIEGNIVDVNDAYCRMSGYSRQELLSMHFSDVEFNESTPELVAQHAQRIIQSGSDRFETRHRRKDGRIIEVEIIATFLKLREPRVFAFMRDITERKRAEEQIRLLAYAVQSARDLICITDGENRFTFVNQSFVKAYGYSQEEILGRTPDLIASPKNSPGLCEHVFRRTLGGSWKGELLNRRKDGTEFPISLSTSEIKNSEGRTIGLIGVASDITERKRAEEEMRLLPLRIIEAQEAERLRVARELHDGVNQLIASAKMRLRKVEDGVVSLNPAAREILARCSRLLVQALEENRRIAHNLRPSDLDEFGLAAATRNFCKELQSRTKLKVKYSIARIDQRLAPALELNLFRILQEAVNNIEKHARAGEVRLRIAVHGDSIILRIQDDGRGFDSKRGRAGRGKWRGIGLTNMRERAEFLGGTCTVESAPKQGTTITVRVPCENT